MSAAELASVTNTELCRGEHWANNGAIQAELLRRNWDCSDAGQKCIGMGLSKGSSGYRECYAALAAVEAADRAARAPAYNQMMQQGLDMMRGSPGPANPRMTCQRVGTMTQCW
ncbi:hypothetical protein [Azospirillum sp. ST 5-10]|uniref:hypothetical protein n=1 Tax=unclassified Azospirillum TaxID=2630922 RepID=UPI003F4A4711